MDKPYQTVTIHGEDGDYSTDYPMDYSMVKDGEPSKPTDTISRRDYFVGQALAGLISAGSVELLKDSDRLNNLAVDFADALIARLDGEGKG